MGRTGGHLGQGREGGNAQCLPQDALGHDEDAKGRIQHRQGTARHGAGQIQDDELVDLAERKPQNPRPHQPKHLSHARIAQGQNGTIAGLPDPQTRQLHQKMPQRSGHRSPGQPNGRGQRGASGQSANEPADDDADVVDRGGHSGQEEVLPRIQRSHDDAAGPKDDRRE